MGTGLYYHVTAPGWAKAVLSNEAKRIEMQVSYQRDSLRELAEASNQLLYEEKQTTQVVFMDEAGEYVLTMSKINLLEIKLDLKWHEDWLSWNMYSTTKSSYTTVFTDTVPLAEFTHNVLTILETILNEYGEYGYKQQWDQHDFPADEYNKLKTSIRAIA